MSRSGWARGRVGLLVLAAAAAVAAGSDVAGDNMVHLKGGRFRMGTHRKAGTHDGEYPARSVSVQPFAMDRYAVTNEQASPQRWEWTGNARAAAPAV